LAQALLVVFPTSTLPPDNATSGEGLQAQSTGRLKKDCRQALLALSGFITTPYPDHCAAGIAP